MRIPVLFASAFCLALPLCAQVPDPGASQDEEAAREKILKAAHQLDLMEGNAEATKTSVDTMKTQMARLEADNAALKAQLSSLQDAFQKSEADHVKERQVLLDEVSKLVASKSGGTPHSVSKKKVVDEEPATAPDVPAPATTGPTNPAESAGSSDAPASADAPAPKPRKGYSYTVEAGQTLSMICAAYRAQGVNVTIAQIRKANGLTEKSVLKVGQKLFIPKPGT